MAATTLPINIFQGHDFYVPAFLVKIEGRDLDRTVLHDVISLSYSDSLANVDSFEMTVSNWDANAEAFDERAFKYSDKDTFNPWKDVEVWMGYFQNGRDERRRMLIGEITTLTPDFPEGGAPTLRIRGLNLLHRFRTKQQTRPFFDLQDTQIAQEIVKDIADEVRKKSPQLQIRLDPEDVKRNLEREQKVPYVLMNNQYPIVFLLERARRNGYELTMEEAPAGTNREVTLRYGPTSDVKRHTYVLEWGKSLCSFSPTLQVASQAAEVTVRGWSPRTKSEIVATVKREEVPGLVTPSELGVSEPDLARKQEIIVDHPIQDEAEATTLARETMRQIGETLVEAKGRTIGVPDLRAGVKVQIRKLGRFSGTYVITSTTHTIGESGYTTEFNARKERL